MALVDLLPKADLKQDMALLREGAAVLTQAPVTVRTDAKAPWATRSRQSSMPPECAGVVSAKC